MSNNVRQTMAAGFRSMEFHTYDPTGQYAAGKTGTITAGAVGSPGFRVLAVKTANVSIPTPTPVVQTGDDNTVSASWQFVNAEPRSFEIEAAIEDMDIAAQLGNTSVRALGGVNLVQLDTDIATSKTVAIIANSRAVSQDAATVGAQHYMGFVIPRATISFLGRAAYTEAEVSVFRYSVVFSQGGAYPWGETFNPILRNERPRAGILAFHSPLSRTLHTFVGDGTVTVFGPLAYAPVITTNVATNIAVFVNGVPVPSGSITVNTSARTVAITPAPALNAFVHVWYEYEQ